jgi:ArsR family transcriptional regulator
MPAEAVELVAARFKVLSEPVRIQILQALHDGPLSGAIGSTQPNVSKHLRLLQDAGFVSRRQRGNTVFYSIADESVFKLCDVVCSSLKEKFAEQNGIFS